MVKDSSSKFYMYSEALKKQVETYVEGLEAGMTASEEHKKMLLAQPHASITQASTRQGEL